MTDGDNARVARRTFRRFRVVAWMFRFVRPVFARVDVRYLGDRPTPGPLIFIANHRSFFDIPVGLEFFLRLRISPQIAVHRRFFKNRVVGAALRFVGAVPVESGTGERWLARAEAELAAGRAVALMPEGKITAEGATLGKLRTGVVRLADGSGVAVLPIGVRGTDAVWPLGRTLPRIRLRRPTIVLSVGRPIMATGLTSDEFVESLSAGIANLIDAE